MTALHEVASFVPPSVPLADLAGKLGLSSMDVRVYQRLFGLDGIAMATGLGWTEQMLAAAGGLRTLPRVADRVRYVIAARSELPMSDTVAFPLRDIAIKLGLRDDVLCFAVAEHACASGLLAVDLAGRLLARDAEPDGLALVLAGEKASAAEVQLIPEQTIMSEGAAAALVAADGPHDRLLSYVSRPVLDGSGTIPYADAYPDVFAEIMSEAIRRAELTWDDIAIVLPHNVNKVSWQRILRLIDLPAERVYLDNVATRGHSFSADPFMNHVDAVADGRLRPGDAYLMTASGVWSVASVSVFRR